MANLKSSKRAIRVTKRRTATNVRRKKVLRVILKTTRGGKTALTDAVRALDKAAQKGTIHPNKAARLKSRLHRAAAKTKTATVASA